MNHDENKQEVQTWIEPELEARVVAWVAGEASAFESAELERLVAEKPELAIFKRRIEVVHGLVAVAVHPDEPPLRLSPERRAKLLQTLSAADGADATNPVSKKPDAPAVFPVYGARQQSRRRWARNATIAAGLMLGLFFATLIKYSSFNHESYAVNLPQVSFEKRVDGERMERRHVSSEEDRTAAENRARIADEERRRQKPEAKKRAEEESARRQTLALRDGVNAPAAFSSPVERAERQALGLAKSQSPAAPLLNLDELSPSSPRGGPENRRYSGLRERGGMAASLEPASGGAGALTDLEAPSLTTKQTRPSPAQADYFSADKKDTPKVQLDGTLASAGALKWSANSGPQDSFGAIEKKGKEKSEFAFKAPARVLLTPPPGATIDQRNEDTVGMVPFSVLAPATEPNAQASSPAVPPPLVEGQLQAKELSEMDTSAAPAKKQIAPAPKPMSTPAEPDLTAEVSAAQQPVSTFSLHVSDVSFRLAEAALLQGQMPDPERIRPEEFYNAFNYGDPSPAMAEKVACHIEQAAHPMLQQRNLVRIAMRVPAVGRGATQPLRLTVMLDTSGSMEREDRAASVHRALEVLVSLLGPNDRLTVIGFARQPHLLVDQLPGDHGSEALAILAHTPAEGGTDLEAALKLASELALRQYQSQAQNRIVLLTDGAANLGNADPAQLALSVEALRQQGVAFDACGVGLDGIDDAMLETLTRKGDGRYYVLNTPEAADTGFARQLAGAFRPAAENVKVQVRFNPARVGAYRLIGFEQHRLKEEDFRNDKVDAAELAADEAAVAIYQVETLPQGEGEIGEVYVRFRDASNGNMVERSWTMSYDPQVAAFDRAAPTLQLAGVATLLAEKLRGGALGDAIKLDELAPVVNALRGHYAHEPRVQELVTMYEQLRRMKNE